MAIAYLHVASISTARRRETDCAKRIEALCQQTYALESPIGSSTEVAPVFIEDRNGPGAVLERAGKGR